MAMSALRKGRKRSILRLTPRRPSQPGVVGMENTTIVRRWASLLHAAWQFDQRQLDYRPSNLDPNERSCRPRKPITTYKTAAPATKSQALQSGMRSQLLSPHQTPSPASMDGQKNQRSVYFHSCSGTSRYLTGSSPLPLNGAPFSSPAAQPEFRSTPPRWLSFVPVPSCARTARSSARMRPKIDLPADDAALSQT